MNEKHRVLPSIEVLEVEIRKLGNEAQQIKLEIGEHQITIDKFRERLTEIDTRIRAIKRGIEVLNDPEKRLTG